MSPEILHCSAPEISNPARARVAVTSSVRLGVPSLGRVAEQAALSLAASGRLAAVVAPGFGQMRSLYRTPTYINVPIHSIPLLSRLERSRSYQLFVRDVMFDAAATMRLQGRYDVLSISGMCHWTMQSARRRGRRTYLICPTSHVESQQISVGRARRLLGFSEKPSELNRYLVRRARREYGLADLLIVASRLVRDSFIDRGFAEDRIAMVRRGVDLGRFRPSEPPAGDELLILFVGQVGIRKGIGTLLDACARLNPNRYVLTLVGDHEPEAGRLLRRQPGVRTRRLQFTADVATEMARCDVLVLPSIEDGFGLVALEAMACGRPVVVSDACGVKEIIEEEGGGLIFPAGNSLALAETLAMLATQPGLRQELGQKARQVAERFSWDVWRGQVAALLR